MVHVLVLYILKINNNVILNQNIIRIPIIIIYANLWFALVMVSNNNFNGNNIVLFWLHVCKIWSEFHVAKIKRDIPSGLILKRRTTYKTTGILYIGIFCFIF